MPKMKRGALTCAPNQAPEEPSQERFRHAPERGVLQALSCDCEISGFDSNSSRSYNKLVWFGLHSFQNAPLVIRIGRLNKDLFGWRFWLASVHTESECRGIEAECHRACGDFSRGASGSQEVAPSLRSSSGFGFVAVSRQSFSVNSTILPASRSRAAK